MNANNVVKAIFYCLLGLLVLLLFSSRFESIIGDNSYFSWLWSVKPSFKFDLCVSFLLLFYTAIRINNCKTESPAKIGSYFVAIGIVFYSYERFWSDYFEFIYFQFNSSPDSVSNIAYADVVYWLAILHFAGYLKYLIPEKLNVRNNKILEDSPIRKLEQDQLSGLFGIPADKIYKIINENQFTTSFTVGLNGEWGDGKTSVFNLLKDRLKNAEDILTVDFNPWMGYDKKVLVKDFFNSLSETLGSSFSDELSDYSNEILNNGDENTLIKIIQSLVKRKEQSLNSIFEDINDKIGRLNKKIVIFIDDVDRLDKEEVFEILKLIRKTANFKNTYFIVAYDRNYVNNSIKDHSGTSVVKYLDKIINVEIGLPYFDKDALKDFFIEHLKTVIPSQLHYKIDYYVESYTRDPFVIDLGFDENDLFTYWLNNFREIKKVINAIVINYGSIYKQVNFKDLIYLEILKLKHPKLYSYLYIKQNEILAINKNSNCYYLAPFDKVKAGNKQFEAFLQRNKDEHFGHAIKKEETIPTVFDAYLEQYIIENNINDIEKERILDIISRLFIRWDESKPWMPDSAGNYEDELSVKFVNKFERYFSHTVFGSNIPEDDFETFLSLDLSNLKTKISEWDRDGKLSDLCFRLNRKFSFKNEIEYAVTISALFNILSFDESHKVNIAQLIGKMFGQKLYPNVFSDKSASTDFFKSLFSTTERPFVKYASMLSELRKRNRRRDAEDETKFPLNDCEIEVLLEKYILEEIESDNLFLEGFWSLYFTCNKLEDDGAKKPFDSANLLLKEKLKINSNNVSFLKSLIIYDGYGYESVLRKGAITDLFGTFENFEGAFLNEQPKDDYIDEFKNYYQQAKAANWESIDFEYDFIKLSVPKNSNSV